MWEWRFELRSAGLHNRSLNADFRPQRRGAGSSQIPIPPSHQLLATPNTESNRDRNAKGHAVAREGCQHVPKSLPLTGWSLLLPRADKIINDPSPTPHLSFEGFLQRLPQDTATSPVVPVNTKVSWGHTCRRSQSPGLGRDTAS